MKFISSIENYPSPVIAIDENKFVAAKNYLASLTFPNVHVGAKISNYTDIEFEYEMLSKGTFYGKEYLYFSSFTVIEGQKYTLIFLSLMTLSKDLLGFDPISSYQSIISQTSDSQDNLKNKKRQYVRSVHNKLIRANYFENFRGLFESERKFEGDETVELKRVCTALDIITKNYLENLNINVLTDHTMPNMIAKVSEIHISSLLINSLLFAVINSTKDINIELRSINNNAEILIEFDSQHDFFELYGIDINNRTDILNSAFSLCVVSKICERCNIGFAIKREKVKNLIHFSMSHVMPIKVNNKTSFSSRDTVAPILEKYLLSVFFNELD